MDCSPTEPPDEDGHSRIRQYQESSENESTENLHISPSVSPQLSPIAGNVSTNQAAPPIQKRRRVTRACDECRRKKIKCDGKQPCTHCTVYSYGMSAHTQNVSVATAEIIVSRVFV